MQGPLGTGSWAKARITHRKNQRSIIPTVTASEEEEEENNEEEDKEEETRLYTQQHQSRVGGQEQ